MHRIVSPWHKQWKVSIFIRRRAVVFQCSKFISHPSKNKDYMDEIVRRVKSLNIMPIPRPKNWNRDQQIEWLQQHPVRHERDVEFLINEVLRVEGVLIRKAAEIASVAVGGRGHWRGNLPYLRMIMCLVQDNVKFLFLICRSNYVSHHVRNSMCNY